MDLKFSLAKGIGLLSFKFTVHLVNFFFLGVLKLSLGCYFLLLVAINTNSNIYAYNIALFILIFIYL